MKLSYKIIKGKKLKDDTGKSYEIPILYKDTDFINKTVKESNDKTDEKEEELIQRSKDIIQDALKKREEILGRATKESDLIREDAKKTGYETGFEAGHNEGYDKGYEDGYNKSLSIIEDAKETLKNAKVEAKNYVERTEDELLNLCIEIARNITNLAIDQSSEKILNMVKKPLEEFKNEELIIIRCHRKGKLHLEKNIDKLKEVCPNSSFTILEDKSLEENGCIIEGDSRTLDIGVSTQLDNIYKELKKMRDGNV